MIFKNDYVNNDRFFNFFEEISGIPHGSGNTEMISDYLVAFARERNLRYIQEPCGNVIIFKDRSPDRKAEGSEDSPVILQGHMDMVAVKDPGVTKNLETEGLDLLVENGFLTADGTTLGADDGIGVAYILDILDDDTISHPPIEAVFTVDEEIGMIGAEALYMSVLKGRRLINIDSEDEGIVVTGCAGGADCIIKKEFKTTISDGIEIRFDVSGLTGGHSGVEIDKERGNAIKILSELLLFLKDEGMEFVVSEITGGEKVNAIPVEARATILLLSEGDEASITIDPQMEAFEKKSNEYIDGLSLRYKMTDPDMMIKYSVGNYKKNCKVPDKESSDLFLNLLDCCPHGVLRYSQGGKVFPETSSNCAIVRTGDKGYEVILFIRSNVDFSRIALASKIRHIAEICNASIEVKNEYGAWEHRPDSALKDVFFSEYEKLTGKKAEEEVIHAGLECGVFLSKIKELDCISIGPQIYDIHTPKERLDIKSAGLYMTLIKNVLQRL